jgi:hypothetical protein
MKTVLLRFGLGLYAGTLAPAEVSRLDVNAAKCALEIPMQLFKPIRINSNSCQIARGFPFGAQSSQAFSEHR